MKAAALRHYLAAPRELIHAQFVATDPTAGTIEFEVDVDVPQRPLYAVDATERVRVHFPEDDGGPEVFVLRNDFPFVPHLVQRDPEIPRQLCLYERPWSEERPNWAPGPFVERIRRWLAGTADGTLHRPDQALEPVLFLPKYRLILPAPGQFPDRICWIERYFIARCGQTRQTHFVGYREQPTEAKLTRMPVLFVKGPTVVHGVVRRPPATLGDLESLMHELGGSLVSSIVAELTPLISELRAGQLANKNLFLVLCLPKRRHADSRIEACEFIGFFLETTIGELLAYERREIKIEGIWSWENHEKIRNPAILAGVRISAISVGWTLLPETAARMNGQPGTSNKLVALGVGALGSQTVNNLLRAGFGKWTLVDDDTFEPHNGARHLLHGGAVGWEKALGVSHYLGELFPGEPPPAFITCNYLDPKDDEGKLTHALAECAAVLDFSAAVSVSRTLALDSRTSARRISVFLNQRGDELVVLAEDAARTCNLIWLETEYMRAVAQDERLKEHFDSPNAVAHRYGNGCRELSTVVPQDAMALHAGLAAARIRAALAVTDATATVFRFDRDSGAVVPIPIPLAQPIVQKWDDWTIWLNPEVIARACALRDKELPVETGGVLLGLVDRVHRFVAVVSLLAAPDDSIQWPTSFIRGSAGLREAVNVASRRTLGNVGYVAEWHSHPAGHNSQPSDTDWTAIALCSPHMEADGLPTFMLIVGEDGDLSLAGKSLGKSRGIVTYFSAPR